MFDKDVGERSWDIAPKDAVRLERRPDRFPRSSWRAAMREAISISTDDWARGEASGAAERAMMERAKASMRASSGVETGTGFAVGPASVSAGRTAVRRVKKRILMDVFG